MIDKAIVKVDGVDVYYSKKTFDLNKTRIPNQTKATKVSELLELVTLDDNAEVLVAYNGKSYKSTIQTLLKRVVFPSLAELGLDQVDNTRDIDKPISTLTKEALNLLSNKDIEISDTVKDIIDQLKEKANKSHVHSSIDEITGLADILSSKVSRLDYNKALNDIAQSIAALDEAKADAIHTHDDLLLTIDQIQNLLHSKIDNKDLTKAINQIMNLLRSKANANHIHLEFGEIMNKLSQLFMVKADKSQLENILSILAMKADIESLLDYARKDHGHTPESIEGFAEIIASLASKNHEHGMNNIIGLSDALNLKASTIQLNGKLDKEEFDRLWETLPDLNDIDLKLDTKLDKEEFQAFKDQLDLRLSQYVTKDELSDELSKIPQASVVYSGCDWN